MKFNRLKHCLVFVLAVCLCLGGTVTAQANSPQTVFYGVTASGAIVVNKECPIEVEKETLNLNVPEFPVIYDLNESEYSAHVTAEYVFKNPADYTVHATLAFPFGELPDYMNSIGEDGNYLQYDDAENCNVTVNGEKVKCSVRHTYNTARFSIENDLTLFSNEKIYDEFFNDDLSVYMYTIRIGKNNFPYNGSTAMALNLPDGDYKVLSEFSSFEKKENSFNIGFWVNDGKYFNVYFLGNDAPVDIKSNLKFYENMSFKKQIAANDVTVTNHGKITYEELINAYRDENVSQIDWYNAVTESLRRAGINNNVLFFDNLRLTNGLMRWLEYDIEIPAGGSITNAVTVPLYPKINYNYSPSIYTYTYLLSPASTWKSFADLTVNILTPYYLTESELEGFNKTDGGYTAHFDTLPEKELVFTLSTDENPVAPKRGCFSCSACN